MTSRSLGTQSEQSGLVRTQAGDQLGEQRRSVRRVRQLQAGSGPRSTLPTIRITSPREAARHFLYEPVDEAGAIVGVNSRDTQSDWKGIENQSDMGRELLGLVKQATQRPP